MNCLGSRGKRVSRWPVLPIGKPFSDCASHSTSGGGVRADG